MKGDSFRTAAVSRVCSLVIILGMVGFAPPPAAAEEPSSEVLESCTDFAIEVGYSRPLEPTSDDVPPEVREFRAARGASWLLYWDFLLQTPRYAVPGHEVPVLPPELLEGAGEREGTAEVDEAALALAARDFALQTHDFLGVGAGGLTDGLVTPVGRSGWVVSFGQLTADGLRVRGAGLRLWIDTDGNLVSLKAYLLRGASEEWEALGIARDSLLSREDAIDRGALTDRILEDATLELAFAAGEPAPLWSLLWHEARGPRREELRDARTGALVASCPIGAYFDASGAVACIAPDLEDPYALPDEVDFNHVQPLQHVTIGKPDSTVLAQTDKGGEFAVPLVVGKLENIVASLVFHPRALPDWPTDDEDADGERDMKRLEWSDVCIKSLDFRSWERHDFNKAEIDDLSSPIVEGGPGVFMLFNANARPNDEETYFNALRIQTFKWAAGTADQSRKKIYAIIARLTDLALGGTDDPLVGEVPPLEIVVGDSRVEAWEPPLVALPKIHQLRLSFISQCFEPDPQGGPVPRRVRFRTLPTWVGHELGHHYYWSLTHFLEHEEVEEAVCDAIAGLTCKTNKILYIGENRHGEQGYILGETPVCGGGLRALISSGFGAFIEDPYEKKFENDPDPDKLGIGGLRYQELLRVIYHILLVNRVARLSDHVFHDPTPLLDELLLSNERIHNKELFLPEEKSDFMLANISDKKLADSFADPFFHQSIRFIRGDVTLDGIVNITDAIDILVYLFLGEGVRHHPCTEAMDIDNNGQIDVTDPISLLHYLFLGAPPPAPPFPGCGLDPTRNYFPCVSGLDGDEQGCPRTGTPGWTPDGN